MSTLAKFNPGQLFITPAVQRDISESELLDMLTRHLGGDWGEVSEADKQENEFSLGKRLRIISKYTTVNGITARVITEADRSSTTIMLADEY